MIGFRTRGIACGTGAVTRVFDQLRFPLFMWVVKRAAFYWVRWLQFHISHANSRTCKVQSKVILRYESNRCPRLLQRLSYTDGPSVPLC